MEPIEPYNQQLEVEEFYTFLSYFVTGGGKYLGRCYATLIFSKGSHEDHALVVKIVVSSEEMWISKRTPQSDPQGAYKDHEIDVKIVDDSEEMWIFERKLVGDTFDMSLFEKILVPYQPQKVNRGVYKIFFSNHDQKVRKLEPLSETRLRQNRLAVYNERLAMFGFTFDSLAERLLGELEEALQRLEKNVWKAELRLRVKDFRIDIGDLVYFEHTKIRAHVEFPHAVKEVLKIAPDMCVRGTQSLGVFECALEPLLYDKIEKRYGTMFFPTVTRAFSKSSPYYLDWSKPAESESSLHAKLHRVCLFESEIRRTIRHGNVNDIFVKMKQAVRLTDLEIEEEVEKSIWKIFKEIELTESKYVKLVVWDTHFTLCSETEQGSMSLILDKKYSERMHFFVDLLPSQKDNVARVKPFSLEGGMAHDRFYTEFLKPAVIEVLRTYFHAHVIAEDSYSTTFSVYLHYSIVPSEEMMSAAERIPHRIIDHVASLYTFTDHEVQECIYGPTPEGKRCNNKSFQMPGLFPDGVEVGHSAVVLILRNLRHEGINLQHSQKKHVVLHKNSTVLTSICHHHAQKDLMSALAFTLQKYKGVLTENNVTAYHAKTKIKSFVDLERDKARKEQEEQKKIKEFEERVLEDSRKRERETAWKPPVVEIGSSTTEASKVAPVDRRCIHTIDNKSAWDCRNVEYTFGATAAQDGEKEMPLPAYIVKRKGNPSQVLGNICYKHAVTLQSSLRLIADHASLSTGTNVTMDDLHVEVHFDSGGQCPQKYDEKEWQLSHEIDPEWKPGDRLSTKWKMRDGEVCFCRFCRKQYFWPGFDHFKKLREQGADPNEVIEFHIYACKPCQDKKVAKGCKFCKAKIIPANIPEDFSLEHDNFYICSKPECWRCINCRKPFSKFSVYQEQEKSLGLENVYSEKDWDKNEEGRKQSKKLRDDYFNATRYPDSRFVCRKCCGNKGAERFYY